MFKDRQGPVFQNMFSGLVTIEILSSHLSFILFALEFFVCRSTSVFRFDSRVKC